jgi:hypothetical protein
MVMKRSWRPIPTPRISPHNRTRRTKITRQRITRHARFLSSMSHLQVNAAILPKIQYGYARDPTCYNTSLHNGVPFDTSDNLYWLAYKICLPNDTSLRKTTITEYYRNAGHPDPNRILLTISKYLGGHICAKLLHTIVRLVRRHAIALKHALLNHLAQFFLCPPTHARGKLSAWMS